jgi:hypothetical protein
MTHEDFEAWLEHVRCLHHWNKREAMRHLGVSKNQSARWTDPNAVIPLNIAIACAGLARKPPIEPYSPPPEFKRTVKMPTTYTIAFYPEALVACVPDGRDIWKAVEREWKVAATGATWEEFVSEIRIEEGLTLTDDADPYDDDIVWTGWGPYNTKGRRFKYAIRAK